VEEKSITILVKRPDNKVTFIQVTSFANEGLVVSFSADGVNDQWPLRYTASKALRH